MLFTTTSINTVRPIKTTADNFSTPTHTTRRVPRAYRHNCCHNAIVPSCQETPSTNIKGSRATRQWVIHNAIIMSNQLIFNRLRGSVGSYHPAYHRCLLLFTPIQIDFVAIWLRTAFPIACISTKALSFYAH